MNIKYASDFAMEIAKQKDAIILEQLGELVTKGLLVVEYHGDPQLFQDVNTNKLIYKQSLRLVLKDKEYIEKLELENTMLKNKLDTVRLALGIEEPAE